MQILPLTQLKSVPFFRSHFLLASLLLALGLAGCSTTDYKDAMSPPEQSSNAVLPRIAVGDTITITLTGIPGDVQAPYEKPITDDGTITLPDIGRIPAAGKTPGELEDYIHAQYVPKFYTHLGVTVKTSDNRVYFVRGEVKNPGRLIYVGPITVTKAITSAGDFTDFANRAKVFLIRTNGKRFRLDCDKILEGKAPDPPVYPGDQIEVKRRLL